MLMVDLNAIYVCWSKVIRDGYFSMSDFANIGNGYNVRVAEVLVRGQLWAESFASSAFIANAETF
jgi:lysozyme family protein